MQRVGTCLGPTGIWVIFKVCVSLTRATVHSGKDMNGCLRIVVTVVDSVYNKWCSSGWVGGGH